MQNTSTYTPGRFALPTDNCPLCIPPPPHSHTPTLPHSHTLLLVVLLALLAAPAVAGGRFEMRVERVQALREGFRVTTSGAVFEVRPTSGEVGFSQRIGARRRLGRVKLDARQLAGLALASHDSEKVVLRASSGLVMQVTGDSVLQITAPQAVRVEVEGAFRPEYLRSHTGAALALDERGGIGVYCWEAMPAVPEVGRPGNGFTIANDLIPQRTFLLCVCPPREYDWKQDRADRIVHFFPALNEPNDGGSPRALPTDDELVAWRKVANVLVLHLEAWDGFGVRHIRPRDPARFRQVIDQAHQLGYRVLPYTSCFYYMPARDPAGRNPHISVTWRKDAVDLYLAEAEWLLKEYGVDGLYWDGTFSDPLLAWEAARRARKLLGSRLLYVHCTFDPLMREGVYCPFADAYCDYILRGETKARGQVIDPIYLRYEASGYNISNTIGTLCYETCRLDRQMIDWALQANVRIPYWPGFQNMAGKRYFLSPEEDRLYRDLYLPRLGKVRAPRQYAPYAAGGRRAREERRRQRDALVQQAETLLAAYLAGQKAKLAAVNLVNLAACRPVRCSHYCDRGDGLHGIGLRPEYAVDGDPQTYWGADWAPAWLGVDLRSVETVSSIRVVPYFGDRRHYHYRVEVSANGLEWRGVAEKTDDDPATGEGRLHRFDPCPARYVRVTMLLNSANCGLHIAELGVYR